MSNFSIRDYQEKDLSEIRSALMKSRKRSALYCLATGGGKTVTAGFMVDAAVNSGKIVWFLTHRREIADQTARTFKSMGIRFGMIMTGTNVRPKSNMQIGMVQTVARRLGRLDAPDLIIFDEAHHTAAKQWQTIYDTYPNAFKVGLTATPSRLDGKGLDVFFEKLVMGKDTAELIKEGHLSPYKMYAPTILDVSSLHIRAGDYKKEELDELLGDKVIIGNIVDTYLKLAMGKKTILFAPTIKTSEKFVAAFNDAGIKAVHVDGKTPKIERDKITQGYHSGEWDVMSNVDLFGEGYDVPDTECIIGARPTMSLSIYRQQCGRALRPIYKEGSPINTQDERHTAIAQGKKPNAIIIDHAGNCFRHGLPCDKVEWSLAPRARGRSKITDESGGMKQCPKCWAAIKSHKKTCHECGHIWVVVGKVKKEVEGNLSEVSKEDIEKIKKAAVRKRRVEQGSAKTLQELIQLGIDRGHKNPKSWATYIWKSRKKKEDAGSVAIKEIKIRRNDMTPLKIRTDMVIFSTQDGKTSVEDAREYIKENALSEEDVKIVRRSGAISVVAKKEFLF